MLSHVNIDAVLDRLKIESPVDDYVYASMPPGLPVYKHGKGTLVFKRFEKPPLKFYGLVISPCFFYYVILKRYFIYLGNKSYLTSAASYSLPLPLLIQFIADLQRNEVEIYLWHLQERCYILQNSTDFLLGNVSDDILNAYYSRDNMKNLYGKFENAEYEGKTWDNNAPKMLLNYHHAVDLLNTYYPCELFDIYLFRFYESQYILPRLQQIAIILNAPESLGLESYRNTLNSYPRELTYIKSFVDNNRQLSWLTILDIQVQCFSNKVDILEQAAQILRQFSEIAPNLKYFSLSWHHDFGCIDENEFRPKAQDRFASLSRVIKVLANFKQLEKISFERFWVNDKAILALKNINQHIVCKFLGCKISGELSAENIKDIGVDRLSFKFCLIPRRLQEVFKESFVSDLCFACSDIPDEKIFPQSFRDVYSLMLEDFLASVGNRSSEKTPMNYISAFNKAEYIFYDLWQEKPYHPMFYRLKTYNRAEITPDGCFQFFADKEEVFQRITSPPYSGPKLVIDRLNKRGHFYGSYPITLNSSHPRQPLPALSLKDKPILWSLRNISCPDNVEWLYECTYKYFYLQLINDAQSIDTVIDFIIVIPQNGQVPTAFASQFKAIENSLKMQMRDLYCSARAAQMYRALNLCEFINDMTIQSNKLHDFLAMQFQGTDSYYLYHPPGGESTRYEQELTPGTLLPPSKTAAKQVPKVYFDPISQIKAILNNRAVTDFSPIEDIKATLNSLRAFPNFNLNNPIAQVKATLNNWAVPIATTALVAPALWQLSQNYKREEATDNVMSDSTNSMTPVITAALAVPAMMYFRHMRQRQPVAVVNQSGAKPSSPASSGPVFPAMLYRQAANKIYPVWQRVSLSQFVEQKEFLPVSLVEVPTNKDMRYIIQSLAERCKRPDSKEVYFLPTPEMLNSYNKGVRLIHNGGSEVRIKTLLPTDHFSELGEFIEREGCNKPGGKQLHIVLDMVAFQENIAQFNGLFPDGKYEQFAQHIKLPRNVKIICIGVKPPGLNDTYYLGADLVRRISPEGRQGFYQCTDSPDIVKSPLPKFNQYYHVIDCYSDAHTWVQKCIGNFAQGEANQIVFDVNPQGLIPLLLNKGDDPIIVRLRNFPMTSDARNFYYNLKYFRYFNYYGLYFRVPNNIFIVCQNIESTTYLPLIAERFTFKVTAPVARAENVLVLNKQSFLELVGGGELAEKLDKNNIVIYCLESFSVLQWAHLANCFQQKAIPVYLIGVPPISGVGAEVAQPIPFVVDKSIQLIFSSEPHKDVNLLASEKKVTILIDHLDSDDLQPAHLNEKTGKYLVAAPTQFIQDIADKGHETLFLVGSPNADMRQFLLPLLLTYKPILTPNGQPITIKIITSNTAWLKGLAYDTSSTVFSSEKAAQKSVNELERVVAVKLAFKTSPVVWIEGETGCGKTSFTYDGLKKCFSSANYYYEIESMEAWLASVESSDNVSVLIVNEGNLAAQRRLSQLMALYINNACMIVAGKIHYLTRKKRELLRAVITANPVKGYEGGRKEIELFKFAQRVIFLPLSWRFIYESILKPISRLMTIQNLERLENFYQFSVKKQAIVTSRILVTMAKMLELAKWDGAQEQHIFWYSAASTFSQAQAREFYAGIVSSWNEGEWPVKHVYTPPKCIAPNYILLNSRQPMYQLLKYFLSIFENSRPKFGIPQPHLTIFALEGEAGAGKTGLVQATLSASDYTSMSVDNYAELAGEYSYQKIYIRLSPSLDKDAREGFFNKLLEIAKTTGKLPLLWIDEDNSKDIDEQILNRVLDVGFHMIVTRNPADSPNYPRRKKISMAVLNRSFVIRMPLYTAEEEKQKKEYSAAVDKKLLLL